jgi:hypothetical protein
MNYQLPRRNAACAYLVAFLLGIAILICFHTEAWAQSSDQEAPTPLKENEIIGRISPRDIGDPRATTHYFIFETQPGDLQVDVTSSDLNGDVDLFFAGNLLPLAKVTLFAASTPIQVSRTLFLREASPVLLRIQARSSGDSTGTYQIKFSGAFLPSTQIADTTSEVSEETNSEGNLTSSGARRVTSVGGRIEETAEKRNEVETAPALPEAASTEDTTSPASTPPAPRKLPRRPAASRRRGGRLPRPPTARRPRTPVPSPEREESEEARGDAASSLSNTKPARTPRAPAATARRQAGVSRLSIRTRDGERVERLMSDVERVIVEGGELVVVLKSGEEQRLQLTEVLRFTIE